jgi:hypothetical protein
MPTFDVTDYGAAGDGVTDDYKAIDDAITAASVAGPSYVRLPAGDYLISQSLFIPSNVTLVGDGIDLTILRGSSGLQGPVIRIVGTMTVRIQSVGIVDITLCHGQSYAGAPTEGSQEKDGIAAECVDGLWIERCMFSDIEGDYCIRFKYARNVIVARCQFSHWTYAGVVAHQESEDVWIHHNLLDTAVSQYRVNSYAVATGYDAFPDGDFFVRRVFIEDNVVFNVPRWEGIDCHGGENVWIRRNAVVNCKMGISLGIATDATQRVNGKDVYFPTVRNPVLRQVVVEGNVIVQGTVLGDGPAIVAPGAVTRTPTGRPRGMIFAQGIAIVGNTIVGYGQIDPPTAPQGTLGAIQVYLARGVEIIDNDISQYAQAAVCLYHSVHDARVRGNYIRGARGASYWPDFAGILLANYGLYGIRVEGNVLDVPVGAQAPETFVQANFLPVSAQVGNNMVIRGSVSALYGGRPDTVTGVRAASPLPVIQTGGNVWTQRLGDVILDSSELPTSHVVAPPVGFGSQVQGPLPIAAVATNGTNRVRIVSTPPANFVGDWEWLPPGMAIIIRGAGPGGADLETVIVDNDGVRLTLAHSPSRVGLAPVFYEPLVVM